MTGNETKHVMPYPMIRFRIVTDVITDDTSPGPGVDSELEVVNSVRARPG